MVYVVYFFYEIYILIPLLKIKMNNILKENSPKIRSNKIKRYLTFFRNMCVSMLHFFTK